MIYAEILAGGTGKRFGNNDLPKQYNMLGSKPIIIHTIEQFVLNPKIDKIVVCTPKEWITYTEDLINKYIKGNNGIEVTEGGSTRNETIINGCNYIEKKYGLTDKDVIITHDAVRPFISQRIIEDNIKAVSKCDAVDTAIPATDTIIDSGSDKVVDADGNDYMIESIPNRNSLWYGQTPQSFNVKSLMKMYDKLTEDEKDILTDACKIFVLKGEKVKIVKGETFNMKITTVFDLKMAEAILMERLNK